ncbi:MAG: DDE-type integrase/transposase/recombinase [Anaerolineales bacterium]|nr:DDE-type integrase/transposase/recombinase [Anaerolineales bacterium]
MSTLEKVTWVEQLRTSFGLATALEALQLPKSTWYYHQNQKVDYGEKYASLRPALEEIARQHPAYGYRRTTTELHENYGLKVSQAVVRRLHELWELKLLRSVRPPAPSAIRQAILSAGERANLVATLAEIGWFEVVYTDFSEIRYAHGQAKAYLMPILAHRCKLVYGWAVASQANTALALTAWQAARQRLEELAINYQALIMHHDQDPVYTSHAWAHQLLIHDGLRLSYALHGARDNPEMESFFSRFKSENHSLLWEAPHLTALDAVVTERMGYYNGERRHSTIENLPPLTYLQRRRPTFGVVESGRGEHG